MNLSAEQQHSIDQGFAVEINVEGRDCVLLRRDVYEKAKAVEENGISPRETYPSVLKAWDQNEDPSIDAYQEYRRQS